MTGQLASLIDYAIRTNISDCRRVAVSFSGGLDSTVLATVAKKYAEVELFTAGVEGSPDLEAAESVAEELALPLFKVIIGEDKTLEAYSKCYEILKLDLLLIEILVPVYLVAEAAAKRKHSILLFGTGAEELFVGYQRYFDYLAEGKDLEKILHEEYAKLPERELSWLGTICKKFGIEARAPLYNKKLADKLFSTPLSARIADRELKKCLLREAARELGVPEFAVKRKKKAMQYGSGVHKLLMKRAEEINLRYP